MSWDLLSPPLVASVLVLLVSEFELPAAALALAESLALTAAGDDFGLFGPAD